MKIHHIAIWVQDIEKIKDYYTKYLGASSNNLYINETTGLRSYFLSFGSGAQIEIMNRHDIPDNANDTIHKQHKGLIHFAFWVDSEQEVDEKAKQLKADGFEILRGPRVTGDGYYEFETIDPENNRFEVMTKCKGK